MPVRPTAVRRFLRAPVCAGASLVCVLATFLPWASSGTRRRSSYELVDVAGRAGVVPEAIDALTWVWFLVPALAGIAVLAAATQKSRTTGVASTTLGALVVSGALLVTRSPLSVEAGALAGGLAGGTTMAIGAVTTVLGENARRSRR